MDRGLPVRTAGVLAILLAALAPAAAETRQVPDSHAEVTLSFAPVVKIAAGSVVNVYGARVEKTRRPAGMDEFFRRFFGDQAPNMAPDRTQRSLGSGVIVDPSGKIT